MCGKQFVPNPWSHQCHPHHTDGETETCRLRKSPDTACAPTVRGLCWALAHRAHGPVGRMEDGKSNPPCRI